MNLSLADRISNCGVSVIVLTYNGKALIKSLLESFIKVNTYERFQFIVVDHASTDGTDKVISKFRNKIDLLVIRKESNRSFSESNNYAVSYAKYDFLFFLNNDIIYSNDFIPVAIDKLKKPEIGAVGATLFNENQEVIHRGIEFLWDKSFGYYRPVQTKTLNEMDLTSAVTAASFLCRKSDFINVGGFCKDYYYGLEDVDFCFRLLRKLKKGSICIKNKGLIHQDGITRKKTVYKDPTILQKNHEVFKKKWRYATVLLHYLDLNKTDIGKRDYQWGLYFIFNNVDNNFVSKQINSGKEISKLFNLLGREKLIQGDTLNGEQYLRASTLFDRNPDSYELIGNIYFDKKAYILASSYYLKSHKHGGKGEWSFINLINSYKELGKYELAIKYTVYSIKKLPHKTVLIDTLDELVSCYWHDVKLRLHELLPDRKKIIDYTKQSSEFIYETYYKYFVGKQIEGKFAQGQLRITNSSRILIIGDYHIPQCVRYRINQKIEQLNLQYVSVESVNWLDLEKYFYKISFFDVLIFYRVPSTALTIKAIAMANAVRKLTIYEIDDLIFDENFPQPIDSYGGYVTKEQYQGLTCDIGLFNSAASLCRVGIASTLPLVEKLRSLTIDNSCILHRNGLDSLHSEIEVLKSSENIKIFYGSGTKAHNSDFNELVLPSLDKLLERYNNLIVCIVGYLVLPVKFLEKHKNKIEQVSIISNYHDYLKLIKQADINVAVLHSDPVNDCKSELKWMEAGFLGIPSVVSKTANYTHVIDHGKSGFVANDQNDWFFYLDRLIKSFELREEMGKNAREEVVKRYSLEKISKDFLFAIKNYVSTHNRKKKKKIVIVNVYFPPQTIGGATRVVKDNVDTLIEKYQYDYEICIFTSDAECRSGNEYQISISMYEDIRVYRCGIKWREHMDWFAQDDRMGRIFTNFLKSEEPELVHFHCIQRLSASIVEATKNLSIPYIITAHDAWWISDYQFLVDENGKVYPNGHPVLHEPLTLPNNITQEMSIDRRIYLKDLLHTAKKVLTVSSSFANIYKSNGIYNIAVTENGISDKIQWKMKDTSYTDKVVCAHIGGMSAHKGYDILKESVSMSKFNNLEFIIVDHSKDSDYEYEDNWGTSKVTFIGRQAQNDIVGLYSKVDVLVAPSIWPESFGLVTREAAACGCWVIASNLGGIGEDIVEMKTGNIISPNCENLTIKLESINYNYVDYKKIRLDVKKPLTSSQQIKLVRDQYDRILK